MAGRSWRRDAGLSRGLGPASAVARILFSSSLWPCPPRLTAGRETALGLCHLPLPSAAAQASDEGQGVQVPVCPLCNSPIPVKTGAVPDVVVGEHMDGACKHHPGKKKEKVLGSKGLGTWAVGGFTRGAGRLAGSALQVESKALM
ncbi:AN1-type zinc finger protein 2A isoform X5 [Neophocaena asiaeorientalis asiaeorientalis]|uniref:AN1-type zinc finger protein 2A isoform X5 n=1 Tax=Neophocaena asiaeorientalis asiaeorientalis TaxID=1706337 RepID=A0A341CWX2_NEOAA|nr:AN1-type zinc finger protein 2A isoform X5 [Neophocaena asiaeorientalis asiaeorientalis]